MDLFIHSGMPWKIFNFVVFVLLLFFALRKGVSQFWQTRRTSIKFQLDEAHELLKREEEKNRHLTERLSSIEQEIARLSAGFREEGELEKKKILENADKQAAQLKEDTKRIIQHESQRAQESLKGEIVRLSIQLSEKIIRERFSVEDQQRLSQTTLKRLEI